MNIVLNSLELMRIYGYLIMPIKHICIPYLQHCLICGNDVLILKYTKHVARLLEAVIEGSMSTPT